MTAKAVLICVDFDTEELHGVDFFEGENPIENADGLRRGVEADWPGSVFIVIGNKEAQEIWGKYLTDELFETENEGC